MQIVRVSATPPRVPASNQGINPTVRARTVCFRRMSPARTTGKRRTKAARDNQSTVCATTQEITHRSPLGGEAPKRMNVDQGPIRSRRKPRPSFYRTAKDFAPGLAVSCLCKCARSYTSYCGTKSKSHVKRPFWGVSNLRPFNN